jgi:fumarylacetoacetase
LRAGISRFLSVKNYKKNLARHLTPMRKAELFLPVAVGDYSDFFTGIHHATNMGRMFRPDSPLLPNYKWVPIGYHGRGSSIVVSGTPVRELGFVIGPGNALSKPIPIEKSLDHVFGVVLLNDWSARDIQSWEYQPLGPFLAKSFATTISPWIVTLDALEPFRCPAFARDAQDPRPLEYLFSEENEKQGGFAITLEMHLKTRAMRAPVRVSSSSFRDSYWTVAQMVAHQTSNGCNLQPGDLLGSGTISGSTPGSAGSMMELTLAGKNPLELPGGEKRAFLEDGDEVIERGRCSRAGRASIGFGEASGRVVPPGRAPA